MCTLVQFELYCEQNQGETAGGSRKSSKVMPQRACSAFGFKCVEAKRYSVSSVCFPSLLTCPLETGGNFTYAEI